MTLADDLKPLVYSIRAIPGDLGLRPNTISIEIETWPGTIGDDATTPTITVTPIVEGSSQPPKIRWLTDEEIAIGNHGQATLEVGPVTPDFSGGGTSWDTLTGASAPANSVIRYIITGPEFPTGARFLRVGADSDRALHYTLRLQRAAT